MSKCTIIIDLLEKHDDSDDEALLQTIIDDAGVDRMVADAYLRSWRFNHRVGAIGAIRSAVRSLNPGTTLPVEMALVPEGMGKAKLFVVEGDRKTPASDPAAGSGKIAEILALHKAGKSNKEIIDAGYNKSTVGRQVGEYKKRMAAAKASQPPLLQQAN